MRQKRATLTLAAMAAGMLMFGGAAQAATISFADAMTVMARDCGADIQKYCKGVNIANNAIGKCLAANTGKVSPTCTATLAAVVTSLEQRLAAQREVVKVCKGDAARRCQGVVQKDAYVLDCLLQAANHVTKKCNAAITDAGWR